MKTRKFNLLDAVLIVFVVALIVVLAFKFTGTDLITAGGEYKEASIVVRAEQIRDFCKEEIKVGQTISLEENSNIKGIIENVEISPAKAEILKNNGTVVVAEVTDKYDVDITVKVEGVQKNDGFYINGTQAVNVGTTRLFRTGYVVLTGTVSQINS